MQTIVTKDKLDLLLHTPVAFFIFRRPDTSARVFAEIARAKPPVLLVVADGPRPDRPGEAEQCAAARRIISQVDWPCEILTNYSEMNLGCRRRLASGLDWVFDTVEEAIILEDDCLPHPTFFRYCEELLAHYRHEPRVMHISGDNFLADRMPTSASYYFSRYCHVWGWASWRRAWRYFDVDLQMWRQPEARRFLLRLFSNRNERSFWQRTWDAVCAGEVDTWDYQWSFACLVRGGLAVMPSANLVSNLGFGLEATNTGSRRDPMANRPTAAAAFPLTHPPMLAPYRAADEHTRRLFYRGPGFLQPVRSRLKTALGYAPLRDPG
jgi:hypothetical protein